MRYIYGLLTLLAALICAVFAVSNRALVSVALWPFAGRLELPVYMLVLVTTVVGLLIGVTAGWFSALPLRIGHRRLRRRLATADAELKRHRLRAAEQTAGAGQAPTALKVSS